MPLNLPQRRCAEVFWNWWTSNAQRVAAARDAADPIFDQAVELLQKYDESLGLEVSIDSGCQRRLVVTAYGNSGSRQSVLDLMQIKPALQDWEVIAFRPAEGADFELDIDGAHVSGSKMWFEPLRDDADPRLLGLEVYFQDVTDVPEHVARTAAVLAIMAVVGESTFMDAISVVTVGNSRDVDLQEFIPLAQLPKYLEWARRRNPSLAKVPGTRS